MKRGDQQSDFPPDEHSSGGTSGSRPEPQNNNGVPDDDPVLLEAALRGDIKAFADLFEGYRQRLYALCLKRLSDHSLAEDIVQEVFVRAFINLSLFDRRKKVWPWLATIAIRMCIDLQRQRSFTHYSGDIEPTADADSNGEGLDGQTGSALDTVLAAEKRAELFQSLAVLPKRQRRVFLLFALDGWSCADIAAAEGISVDAVYHLLFRARKKMRIAYQNGVPALVALPFAWLHGKIQRTADRIRVLLGLHGEGLSAACMQAVCLGAAAMTVVALSPPAESFGSDSLRSAEAVLSATQSQAPNTASLQSVSPNIGVPAKAPVEPKQSVADPSSSLVDDVINPNQSATPEDTRFGHLTPSPKYESDHTILAGGLFNGNRVLFISYDGGGTWQPRPSRLLDGFKMILPPDFPQDRRIFAFGGNLGLQQSDDGGETFRVVGSIFWTGSAEISPSLGRGVSKILMVGTPLIEFDTGTGLMQPILLNIPPGEARYAAYSPGYQFDSTILVFSQPAFYRCVGLICDKMENPHPDTQPPKLRSSPRCHQEGLTYAFTPWKLLVSHDGFRTVADVPFPIDFRDPYRTLQYPYSSLRAIYDLAVLCNTPSESAIFAAVNWTLDSFSRSLSGIYRSFDAGRSWSKTLIDLPGFEFGANKLLVTPTGRLLATGTLRGIACSVDLGETWRPRCPPEP